MVKGYMYSMETYSPFAMPSAPKLKFARKGANPSLATIEYVLAALKKADGPVSRNWILATLASWGHSTTRQSLNAALRFLDHDAKVAQGSKGIIYVPPARGEALEAIRRGVTL